MKISHQVLVVLFVLTTLTALASPRPAAAYDKSAFVAPEKDAACANKEALGLRPLSHRAVRRHSVASQAATSGHSIKAIQAQLGHRSEQSTHVYAHLGSRAQLRLVEALQPAAAPHGTLRAPSNEKGT